MYRTWCAALLALVVLAAGCGGKGTGNGAVDGGGGTNAAGGKTDEHEGPKAVLGERDVEGGLKLKVIRVGAFELGKEGVFEVLVTKDGTIVRDVAVTSWLGEKQKELNEIAAGEWRKGKTIEAFDVHMFVPKDLPAGTKLWVRLKIADKSTWWDFDPAQ
ncbi:MAG: hypothetical protein IT463_07985 [Planctomycetes bacterium]|nr:hypothetical protein [Planctomycetota bacterium]